MTHVLLIDDESASRLVMASRLRDAGYEMTVAENGAQALTCAREQRFDLVLLDAALAAGIPGLEVCRRLKQMPQYQAVPLVLIGRSSSREDVPKGYEAGCDAYLLKSDLPLLEHVLKVLVRRKRERDELLGQLRALDDQNRRLTQDGQRPRAAEGSAAVEPGSTLRDLAAAKPDGVMLVDGDGLVRWADRGACDLFGGEVDACTLGQLAPSSGLAAFVRDAHSETCEGLRFDLPARNGRAGRSLLSSVVPLIARAGEVDPGLRVVILLDLGKRRVAAELVRLQEYTLPRREAGVLLDVARYVYGTAGLIGASDALTRLRAQVTEAAHGAHCVLIQGEEGSGRQHAARALHFGAEGGGPFLPVACAGLSEAHLEAELFGQVKGATRDALADRPGALQLAARGTVFLQDVERLPKSLQAKLLRVLRDGVACRAGSERAEPVEARVVASTKADLEALAAKGRFDAELAALLGASRICTPPLRERREDLSDLVTHFLRMFGSGRPELEVAPDALQRMYVYPWPGNVAELKSCVERACKHATSNVIGVEDLSPALRDLACDVPAHELVPTPKPAKITVGGTHVVSAAGAIAPAPATGYSAGLRPGEVSSSDPISLDHYERKCLERALAETGGDKLAAARLLQVGKSTLYRKLKRYGIA